MLVSIIIPIYNVEQYIETCLDSVASQTYKGDIECMLIDDKSTDRSLCVAEHYIQRYNGPIKFRIVSHGQNKGASAARNTGIRLAKGDYILFLDSDDELATDCLDQLMRPLQYIQYDVVAGGYTQEQMGRFVSNVLDKDYLLENNNVIHEAFINQLWNVMPWNKLCSRNFVIKNSLFFVEGIIYEDELWSFQIANTASSMYLVSNSTYRYKLRDDSVMGSVNKSPYEKINKKIILYSKMENYVFSDIPFNRKNYRYLESKRNNLLNDIYINKSSINIKDLYKKLHRDSIYPKYILKYKQLWNIKNILRDIHLFIPSSISFYYWLVYRRIHNYIVFKD